MVEHLGGFGMSNHKRMFNSVYQNKRVLITGHTGFKGTWMTFLLKEMGAEVCGFSLAPETTPSHFDLINLKNDIRLNQKTKLMFFS